MFGTSAATFNDDGVTALYQHLRDLLAGDGLPVGEGALAARRPAKTSTGSRRGACPPSRVRYLAEIAETVRGYHADDRRRRPSSRGGASTCGRPRRASPATARRRRRAATRRERALPAAAAALLDEWPRIVEAYSGDELVVTVRDRELRTPLTRETLSGNRIRRVALPRYADHGELLRFLRAREPARPLPVHRRGVPVQARGRGPGADVRRRGRPVPHQPPLPPALRGQPGHPAVDRVRLGDPLRPRPRHRAPTSTARSAPPASRSPPSTT